MKRVIILVVLVQCIVCFSNVYSNELNLNIHPNRFGSMGTLNHHLDFNFSDDGDGFSISGLFKNMDGVINDKKWIGFGPVIGESAGLSIKWWKLGSFDLKTGFEHHEAFLKSWFSSHSYWLPLKRAWAFQVSYPLIQDGYLHVHLDHLWHHYTFSHVDVGMFLFYWGLGARVRLDEDENVYGFRGVLGMSMLCIDFPVEFFLEAAPVYDIEPEYKLDYNAGIGIRIYFH